MPASKVDGRPEAEGQGQEGPSLTVNDDDKMPPLPFGHALRDSEFGHLEQGLTRLNHGSYGAAPRCVLAAQDGYRARQHADPDSFLGGELARLMVEARTAVASLVGGHADQYALVDNATTAATTVSKLVASRFQSGEYQPGDRIMVTRWMYDSCFKAFHEHCGRLGAVFVIVDLPGPPLTSTAPIVDAFRRELARLEDPWIGKLVLRPLCSSGSAYSL